MLVRPTKDLESATIIEAFDSTFTELKTKGFKPQLNITDNQAVAALKDYLATKHCEWQFVQPNNHRVNATERAIQTFKIILLVASAPQTLTFHSNCGTSWQYKRKTH
jgi:hypothetical protein